MNLPAIPAKALAEAHGALGVPNRREGLSARRARLREVERLALLLHLEQQAQPRPASPICAWCGVIG